MIPAEAINKADNTPKISINEAKSYTCKKCGSELFEQVVMIKKISKILTGAPEDQKLSIPIFRCADCKEILEDMIPEGLTLKDQNND